MKNQKEPDYRELENWAASPHKKSPSDQLPSFIKEEIRKPLADVFFIHPTTYLCAHKETCQIMVDLTVENRFLAEKNKDPLNADIRDVRLNTFTDEGPIKNQASVFNQCCRIFAPRYRQAHVKAFFLKPGIEVEQALDLAYADVKRAFEYYIAHENNGRPMIIAGHSQGTFHAMRLLREFFDGTVLQKQLVYACIPGFQLRNKYLKTIPFLKTPDAVGGFLGWRSYQRGHVPENLPGEQGNSLCVNPFTFTNTQEKIMCKESCGIEGFEHPLIAGIAATVEPHTKALLVDLPKKAPEKMRRHQNLHLYDYSLFWQLIRKNATQRVYCFLDQ